LRAEVFRCMTPLVTALSRMRIASRTTASAVAALAPTAASAAFTAVRSRDRSVRFRSRRRSFCLIRLIADFVFATIVHGTLGVDTCQGIISAMPITVARPASRVPAKEGLRPLIGSQSSPILTVQIVRLRRASPCVLDLLGSRPGAEEDWR